ncbi:MAG TPA: 50S ribosomal protein L11 [Planctomycetia bacterium]|nr:50S ribosomal protein L11 [Planctomycetia bacterium]
MAKARVKTAEVKLQCPGGQATPSPPVGPALGQHGVNIGKFVQEFNAATKEMPGITIPVIVSVYSDRTFEFILKTPPASVMLRLAAGVPKGAGNPLREKVGKVTAAQVREIATKKLPDMNSRDVDHAMRVIRGTARSMGIEIVD